MPEANLKVLDVAKFCKCCRSTILNYERKGIINSTRDIYNARRFTQAEAEKLRSLMESRWPSKQTNE
jgi:DNA-binding transcriptional MerR regulator